MFFIDPDDPCLVNFVSNAQKKGANSIEEVHFLTSTNSWKKILSTEVWYNSVFEIAVF